MNSTDKEDTINKSILLNWLYSSGKEISIIQLGQWISARTNGKYTMIKNDKDTDSLTAIENRLNNKY
jgi:hypothetical protein